MLFFPIRPFVTLVLGEIAYWPLTLLTGRDKEAEALLLSLMKTTLDGLMVLTVLLIASWAIRTHRIAYCIKKLHAVARGGGRLGRWGWDSLRPYFGFDKLGAGFTRVLHSPIFRALKLARADGGHRIIAHVVRDTRGLRQNVSRGLLRKRFIKTASHVSSITVAHIFRIYLLGLLCFVYVQGAMWVLTYDVPDTLTLVLKYTGLPCAYFVSALGIG